MQISSFFAHPYHALILKVTGFILILGTLVDYVLLAVPSNFASGEWMTALISQWLSRGTVPLLGLAILFLGVWFEGNQSESTNRWRILPSLAVFLSALLGIFFVVLTPLYFNSTGLASEAQTTQINQQATQAENQLNQLLEQQRAKVNAIVSNEDQLAQLQRQIESINNSNLSEDQQTQLQQIKSTLEKVKSDPKALDQEVSKARTQGMEQIKQKQQDALNKIQTEMRRDRLDMIVSSLLFAIGYLTIAWTGFSSLRRSA